MLHTKFQGHRPFGSREEDFLRFLLYMGMAANLVMWPEPFEQTFVPQSHGGSIWNLASTGLVASGEDVLKCWRTTDDVRRKAEACLYCKLTSEPKVSGELIIVVISTFTHIAAYMNLIQLLFCCYCQKHSKKSTLISRIHFSLTQGVVWFDDPQLSIL